MFSDLTEAERIEQVQACLDSFDDHSQPEKETILLGCLENGNLIGAVLAQIQAGRVAMVRPPRLSDVQRPEIAEALLHGVCEQLCSSSMSMAHVLFETVDENDDRALRGCGFTRLAELLYMSCEQSYFPAKRPSQSPLADRLDFEPYTAANHDRFSQTVEKTYNQTLDCPRLNGVRSIEDVLAGYRDLGEFSPERWFIVSHQGCDVGCLVIADHPEHDSCELVYMGIVASARGHGWGKEIAQYAKWVTSTANRPRLVLAVDSENRPAIDMYSSVGFRVWEKRIVYAKFFC